MGVMGAMGGMGGMGAMDYLLPLPVSLPSGRVGEGALLLSDEHVDGTTRQLPVLANLVLEEALVGFLHILWQIGIEHEGWNLRVRHLRAILNLDVLSFDGGWRIGLDER
jgi:hypothetical protein